MKRILFLVSSMEGGGAERVAALLCNHWVMKGHSVTLMPTFSGRGECIYPLDDRVVLDFLADRVGSRKRSSLNKIRRMVTLRQTIQELSPDVVVSFLPPVNVAALLAVIGLRTRVIVSERIYPPLMSSGWLLSFLRRVTYPSADVVVMQTRRGISWLNKMIPTAAGAVIPNPAVYPLSSGKPEIEPNSVLPSSRLVLLAVGRLDMQKGFDILLSAFSKLTHQFPEWDLVILGEGSQREQLERQVHKLGLDAQVHLPGRVGNLADWYQRADLYVMSSRFEGFPNTLIEAMAYGLPAVSFGCKTGPEDIIRDGIDGVLVFPEANPDSLSRALAEVMKDPGRLERMGWKSVEVRERFSMPRISALWDEVLWKDRK